MGRLTRALLIGGLLTPWYLATTPSCFTINSKPDYPLPNQIKAVETSLPCESRERIWTSTDSDGKIEKKVTLEKIVDTKKIDFSKNFYIKTDRYTFVKDEDWLPERVIGQTLSVPVKLLFMDYKVGWGQDEKRARASLSMLENNSNMKDITLRINHNHALHDMMRLFTDEKLVERNNFFTRAFLGVPSALANEVWAGFFRGSYYNPITNTAVCYSNVESITAHEIGHHKDFQRFDGDGEYTLARGFSPVMMYQEWAASRNAKKLLSADDQWQFNRYLLPAFGTYLLAGYYMSRAALKSKAPGEGEEKEPNPLQTLRHFGTLNLDFLGGITAYGIAQAVHAPEIINDAAFVLAAVATNFLANSVLSQIIPYKHEEEKY